MGEQEEAAWKEGEQEGWLVCGVPEEDVAH